MGKRIIIVILMLLFVISLSIPRYGEAEDISSPANVNQIISDFSDIDMKPGEDEDFEFELYNPYELSMKNITLQIQIYDFKGLDGSGDEDKMDDTISFKKNSARSVIFETDELNSEISKTVSYRVNSDENTRKGVYSVRFNLSFDIAGENVSMKSIGYFTNQELKRASEHEGNNDGEHFVGGYNLTRLGVDGILKETSVAIKEPKPRWLQYALGATTVTFSLLAVYFYLKENRN
ncbi:MAG: hypothetical protein ACOCSL_03180 [Thermoplasmatota archaeon]